MRAALVLTMLAAGATGTAGAMAQELSVDRATVEACFQSGREDATALPGCVGEAAAQCQTRPGGATTLGIGECLAAETVVWSGLMTQAYDDAIARLGPSDARLTSALEESQAAWVAYRAADCGLQYVVWMEGSIRTVVAGTCHLKKTAARAFDLLNLGDMK